jgi:hypothetical protein
MALGVPNGFDRCNPRQARIFWDFGSQSRKQGDVPFANQDSLSKDKTELRYNEALTLRGIPSAAFDYRLGHRSALEWVIDQYRVSTDARSGITNDPKGEVFLRVRTMNPQGQDRTIRSKLETEGHGVTHVLT